jgi:hypothetical protein
MITEAKSFLKLVMDFEEKRIGKRPTDVSGKKTVELRFRIC